MREQSLPGNREQRVKGKPTFIRTTRCRVLCGHHGHKGISFVLRITEQALIRLAGWPTSTVGGMSSAVIVQDGSIPPVARRALTKCRETRGVGR